MFRRSLSETDLIKASLHGNPQAFGTVIERYASLICAITYSATGNVAASEELAQETFLRAWKHLHQLKNLGKFRPWLCRIARNTVQNWFRDRRHDIVGHAAPLEAAANETADKSEPVEAAMNREQQVVVGQALAQIPEQLREPLILFYREQQSTRQVAKQLGLSENAARQRISRARSLLRAQVAAMVENTIAQTKPGKAFTAGVTAAIVGATAKTGTATAATAALGIGTKFALAAASLVVVAGAIWVHHRSTAHGELTPAPATVQSTLTVPSESSDADPGGDRESTAIPEANPESLPQDSQIGETPDGAEQSEAASTIGTVSAPASTSDLPDFQPKGVLSGKITDVDTGEPIPGALVRISDSTHSRLQAQTDANGFYRFEQVHQADSFEVTVDALTHVGIRRGQGNPTLNLSNDKQCVRDFQLPRACMVDVWVVDQNGVGIPGALVVATSLSDAQFHSLGAFADRCRTDPNGYVLVGGISSGTSDYLITAWHRVRPDGQGSTGGPPQHTECDYAPGRAVVRLPDPNVIAEATVVLADGQPVSGYAEYADGVPAAGVLLDLCPRWWHCSNSLGVLETADDGTFTFDHVAPGAYDISWGKPLAPGVTLSYTVMEAELPTIDGKALVVRLPENSPQLPVSIRGIITLLGEGTPGQINITASSAKGIDLHKQVPIQGDGTARFELQNLQPGSYELSFSGHNLEDKIVRDVLAPSDDFVVEMVCAPRPILTGTVRDARTVQPIPQFQARVRRLQILRDSLSVQPDRWMQIDDPQGRFELEAVGPGVYDIQVRAEGYAPRWSEQINTDESPEVLVLLTAGGAISGQVVDEKGQPIDGAQVTPLSVACGVTPPTRTAFLSQEGTVEVVEGKFRLAHLPPGLETLKVTHPDYAPEVVTEILVSEGESADSIQIRLSAGAMVEGYVYDGNGQPLAGETIVFQETSPDPRIDKSGRLASVSTDSHGFYRAMHLPEKPCYVRRGNMRQPLGVVLRTVVPSGDHVTRLDLGGTPIVAGVVVLDGAPQRQTYLRLSPADPQAERDFTCYAMTDAEGAFAFNGVVPGTHAILCQPPGRPFAWQQIATIEVGDRDVNVGPIPTAVP